MSPGRKASNSAPECPYSGSAVVKLIARESSPLPQSYNPEVDGTERTLRCPTLGLRRNKGFVRAKENQSALEKGRGILLGCACMWFWLLAWRFEGLRLIAWLLHGQPFPDVVDCYGSPGSLIFWINEPRWFTQSFQAVKF
jgi:hypothetical protein